MHTSSSCILHCLVRGRCFIEVQTRLVYRCQWSVCLCSAELFLQNRKLCGQKVKVRLMDNNGGSAGFSSKSRNQSQFVKQEEVARGKWLSLSNITYKDPLGQERIWESVCRTTGSADEADAVFVIPILKRTLKYDCVIMVKQYRPPMKAYTLEFPAGLVDKGETPEETAVRELREETGYSGKVKHISPATCLDPGIGNTSVRVVTVEIDGDEDINTSPKSHPEESEFIDVLVVPMEELLNKLNEMASAGVVIDSRVYTYAVAMEQTRKVKKVVP
ncbi:ADP-sugar pyrophosphatase-like [Haliotis rubra]|uniref:ADP-sugar pyrophosphatase-like n=1 Tax=Haliotis rubra TaxID=36100 RepID=UPI001EE6199F|nr:ADP-sugar pyrophosphatase-like [Haliotis rubra]